MRATFQVRVVTRTGVEHLECPTGDLWEAEDYARTAIEDGCLAATVIRSVGAVPVSRWDPETVALWNLTHH